MRAKCICSQNFREHSTNCWMSCLFLFCQWPDEQLHLTCMGNFPKHTCFFPPWIEYKIVWNDWGWIINWRQNNVPSQVDELYTTAKWHLLSVHIKNLCATLVSFDYKKISTCLFHAFAPKQTDFNLENNCSSTTKRCMSISMVSIKYSLHLDVDECIAAAHYQDGWHWSEW